MAVGIFDPAIFDPAIFDPYGTAPPAGNLWSAQGYTSATNVVVAAGATLILDTFGDCRSLHVQVGGTLLVRQGGAYGIRAHGTGFGIKIEGDFRTEDGLPISHGASAAGVYGLDLWVDGITESGFLGTDAAIGTSTDPGVTVMNDVAHFSIRGAAKTEWARASASVPLNATFADLDVAPTNWNRGDVIRIAPTQATNVTGATPFYDRYTETTVLSVVGNRVNFETPVDFAHPQVNVLEGFGGVLWMGAEVTNYTRNVRVRGGPGQRAHMIWYHVHLQAQQFGYAELVHVGPRQAGGLGVLGRYPVHFHHCGDGSRGSVLQGLTVVGSGNGGIVAHGSHGILHDACVIFDVALGPIQRFSGDPPVLRDEPNFGAFWWDRSISTYNRPNVSHDTHWRRCGVLRGYSLSGNPTNTGGTRINGFTLGEGAGNILEDCWVAGIWGNTNAAGINWPEAATSAGDGVWTLRGINVSHNNRVSGSFAWTNDTFITGDLLPHLVQETGRMVCYHNGFYGYDQGAYARAFHHVDAVAYGNAREGYHSHAFCLSAAGTPREEITVFMDGASIGLYGFNIHNANLNPQQAGGVLRPTLLLNCRVARVTVARYAFIPPSFESSRTDLGAPPRGAWHDVVDGFAPGATLNAGGIIDFFMGNTLHAQSVVRVQDTLHGALRLRPARLGRPGAVGSVDGPIAGQPGETLNTLWNAWVLSIAPFYP